MSVFASPEGVVEVLPEDPPQAARSRLNAIEAVAITSFSLVENMLEKTALAPTNIGRINLAPYDMNAVTSVTHAVRAL
jgi:hypothetical protein